MTNANRSGTRNQMLEALFQAGGVIAQSIDVTIELADIAGARNERLFLGPVFGEAARDAVEALRAPLIQSPPRLYHAVCSDVTEDAREIFLDVPTQIARNVIQNRGKVGIAAHRNFAPYRFVAGQHAQQDAWCENDHQLRRRLAHRGSHFAGFLHGELEADEREFEPGSAAGKGFELLER